jgi:hypothetical protein
VRGRGRDSQGLRFLEKGGEQVKSQYELPQVLCVGAAMDLVLRDNGLKIGKGSDGQCAEFFCGLHEVDD